MYIRNKWLFMLWKVLLVVICAYGLGYHMRDGRWGDFNYYTVLSNAACFIYFLVSIVFNVRRISRGVPVDAWRPGLEKAVVFCITVTFLIYNFILRPEAFRMGNGGSFYTVLNIVQHYILPIMVIFDWLLFCRKGGVRRLFPLSWLLIPLAYLAYILLRAPIAGNIGSTDSPYPYGFINVSMHGMGGVLTNAAWIAVGMLLLAYLIYFIDLGLAMVGSRRPEKGLR